MATWIIRVNDENWKDLDGNTREFATKADAEKYAELFRQAGYTAAAFYLG